MTVVVIAGRRVDPKSTESPQFPEVSVPAVTTAIHHLLEQLTVTILVSSAACGVDLVAIQAATTLGARTRLILPFRPDRFKLTSVTDRPGRWEEIYDPAIHRASQADDLVILDLPDGEEAYLEVNQRLIDEAQQIAGLNVPHGVIVWNGSRPKGMDVTADFARRAITANFILHTLSIPQGDR